LLETFKKFLHVEISQVLLIKTNGQNQPPPFSLAVVLRSLLPKSLLLPRHDLPGFILYKNLMIRVFDYH
jgi:hypothetical protein